MAMTKEEIQDLQREVFGYLTMVDMAYMGEHMVANAASMLEELKKEALKSDEHKQIILDLGVEV